MIDYIIAVSFASIGLGIIIGIVIGWKMGEKLL